MAVFGFIAADSYTLDLQALTDEERREQSELVERLLDGHDLDLVYIEAESCWLLSGVLVWITFYYSNPATISAMQCVSISGGFAPRS